ncbi:MAG: hypothetical protein HOE48_01945 [Candidatus Latescibacteria bacterium]|jgi:hypothetical protein|nr:hypothetical protein [Candidatus Latescibacterota bacterium]MBT4136642.1 hypothetical protein [Candidatus Latescibacterota bacterium]MBT5831525.1 hypothetical protein [Candidatus Latescibacterota bacterium]
MPAKLVHISPQVSRDLHPQADLAFLPGIEKTAENFMQSNIQGMANQWLLDMPWKRPVAFMMLADLVQPDQPAKEILEIGGNLSYFTYELAKHHNYILVDKATHETEDNYHKVETQIKKTFVHNCDWADFTSKSHYDIVIANDIFPNVDQRLYEFVDRFLPQTQEMRLTLTYYEDTSFEVQRLASGEMLTMRPWGLRDIRHFMTHLAQTYPSMCKDIDQSQLVYHDYSGTLFSNRRNVIYLHIQK